MASRPTWFWTSLFSSIGVNAVLLTSSACWLYSQTPIYLPGYARGEALTPIFVELPPPVQDTVLGQADGKGDAADTAPGDTPMEAALGPQGQAFLSRDPAGPGKIGQDPSMSTQIPGENGNGNPSAQAMFGAGAPAEAQPSPQFARAQTPPQQNRVEQTHIEETPPEQTSREQASPVQTPREQASPVQTPRQQTPPEQAFADQPAAEQAQAKRDSSEPIDPKLKPNEPRDFGREPRVDPPPAPESAVTATPKPETPAPETPAAETPAPETPAAETAVASAAELINPATPPPAAPSSPQMQSRSSGKPGPSIAPADPAPQSDSESDPFSRAGAVKFKSGSTDIQFGRKHKIVRPRLGLAGQTALLSMHPPITLVLALSLDETGKVVRVQILQSSGSPDIDQACKVAAYQWWLEPTKDKSGKPIKDVVPFSIGIL